MPPILVCCTKMRNRMFISMFTFESTVHIICQSFHVFIDCCNIGAVLPAWPKLYHIVHIFCSAELSTDFILMQCFCETMIPCHNLESKNTETQNLEAKNSEARNSVSSGGGGDTAERGQSLRVSELMRFSL